MAKRNPPKIAVDEVPKVPPDELDRFLEQAYFRIRNNIAEMQKGKLNSQWVALEAIGVLFPLMENGADHDMLRNVYPVESWRKNTVEVPIELLGAIVSGWNKYADSSKTLGQAFGFEKVNRQGTPSMKKVAEGIDRGRRISARVLVEHTQIGDQEPVSKEIAIAKVADELGVSESTVERAYREFGASTFETLKSLKEIDFIPGKSSRTDDVDG